MMRHRAAPDASATVPLASVGAHHADCDDESRLPMIFLVHFACEIVPRNGSP